MTSAASTPPPFPSLATAAERGCGSCSPWRPSLLEHATSAGTRRAYATDWGDFADWAGRHRLTPLPAEPRTIALYITAAQHWLRPATLLRRLSAISVAHRAASHASPTGHELVRRAVAGLRRKHGARPAGKTALVNAAA